MTNKQCLIKWDNSAYRCQNSGCTWSIEQKEVITKQTVTFNARSAVNFSVSGQRAIVDIQDNPNSRYAYNGAIPPFAWMSKFASYQPIIPDIGNYGEAQVQWASTPQSIIAYSICDYYRNKPGLLPRQSFFVIYDSLSDNAGEVVLDFFIKEVGNEFEIKITDDGVVKFPITNLSSVNKKCSDQCPDGTDCECNHGNYKCCFKKDNKGIFRLIKKVTL